MLVPNTAVRARVVAAGIPVDKTTPEPYRTATTKNAKDHDTYPCVVRSETGQLSLVCMRVDVLSNCE